MHKWGQVRRGCAAFLSVPRHVEAASVSRINTPCTAISQALAQL
jgi:hypothetical protein